MFARRKIKVERLSSSQREKTIKVNEVKAHNGNRPTRNFLAHFFCHCDKLFFGEEFSALSHSPTYKLCISHSIERVPMPSMSDTLQFDAIPC